MSENVWKSPKTSKKETSFLFLLTFVRKWKENISIAKNVVDTMKVAEEFVYSVNLQESKWKSRNDEY